MGAGHTGLIPVCPWPFRRYRGAMSKAWLGRVWARWAWPIVTFFVIGAFMIITVVVRGGAAQSDAATPNAFLPPLEPAQHVTTREWRAIAADPLAHPDERVVLWGRVTRYEPGIDASTVAGPGSAQGGGVPELTVTELTVTDKTVG